MFRVLPLSLCLLSLVGQGDAALITSRPAATPTIKARIAPKIDAIVPTTAGQIGINPVESDLGDPDTYLGTIYGTDTQYITMDAATTKWIGVNTEYLSMDGTSTVDVVIATATAEANGQNIGDISVILPEGLADALTNSMTTAIDACGGVVTKKMRREIESRESRENLRRQADAVLSCVFQYAKIDAEEGGTFDAYIEATEWIDAGFGVAQDAAAVLVNYIASLSQAEAAKTIVWLALFSIAVDVMENEVLTGESEALSPVGKVNIPASGFATNPPDEGCDGTEEVTQNSPLCLNSDCQGEATGLCTMEPNTNCPCILTIPRSPGAQPWNQSWTDFQQQWLLDVFDSSDNSNVQDEILRIMPLGDSITYGYQSTDGNGYRLELYNDLTGGYNNTVDLIGSVQAGTMADNYNEGHSGATIDEIASFASLSLFELPNVVLIHAGTNDMNLPLDPADAPTRLGNLIDTVLATVPDAVLLVAQIIPSGTQATEDNIVTFNAAIPGVVASRVAAGSKVLVVDMFTRLTYPDDFTDDLHPNDQGYQIMGDVWYEALGYADTVLNWITPPAAASSHNGDILCQQLPTWYPQGEVANGAGLGADAYPDIICLDYFNGDCACGPADGSGPTIQQLLTGDSCADMSYDLIHAVHFADMNGDGRAEYLWVDENGAVTAFLNLGSPSGEESYDGAQVQWLPQGVIATGVGAARQEVQFADLNGDGRAEYLWVHPNGSVEAWLNLGGPNDGPNAAQVGWLYQGLIATGIGAPGSSISFADINGDGRAEYLSTDANGAVTCYLNLGPTIDDGPHAAIVGWLPQGVIATGVGGVRNQTVFADINGDGRAEYLEVARSGSGAVSEWLNGGGPNDGPNAAQVIWYPQGQITTGDGTSGANVVFADLNGDGRAEYIEIDPASSAITVYLNACQA